MTDIDSVLRQHQNSEPTMNHSLRIAVAALAAIVLALGTRTAQGQAPVGPFTGMFSERFEQSSPGLIQPGDCFVRQYVGGAASICAFGELYIMGPGHSGQTSLFTNLLGNPDVESLTFAVPIVKVGTYVRCNGTCQITLRSATNTLLQSWSVPDSGGAWNWFGSAFAPATPVARIEIIPLTPGNLPGWGGTIVQLDDLQIDVAAGSYVAHPDLDADGFGDASSSTVMPVPFPAGMRFDGLDCSDSDPGVNPAATEIPCNGKDDDCNGVVDAITTYCTPKVNSLGCVPIISFDGYPNLAGPDNFHVTASNVMNRKAGVMLWSLTPGAVPFLGGTLCVAAPITRTLGQNSLGSPLPTQDCSGSYSYHLSHAYMITQLLPPATHLYAQYWSRDPGSGPPHTAYNIGLTNALSFVICP